MAATSMECNNKSSQHLHWKNISHICSSDLTDFDSKQLIFPIAVVGFMTLLGVCGNLLVLIIFIRKRRKRTHTIFILGLAFVDFMVCSVTLPFEMYEIRNTFTFYSTHVCKIFRTYNYLCVFWSTFILIFLSVDRFKRVCQPIGAQISHKGAYILIFIALVLSLIFSLPHIYLQGIQVKQFGNKTAYQCSVAEEYLTTIYPIIYHQIVLGISIVNILTVLILYILIGRKVVQHIRYRTRFRHTPSNLELLERNNSSSIELVKMSIGGKVGGPVPSTVPQHESDSSFKITKIALTIGICFILSYVPSVVLSLVEATLGKTYMNSYTSPALGFIVLAERMFIINHVVNPFVYGFLDASFRLQCKEIYSKLLCMIRCEYCPRNGLKKRPIIIH